MRDARLTAGLRQVAHPGWIINQQTFAIEAEKKAEEKK